MYANGATPGSIEQDDRRELLKVNITKRTLSCVFLDSTGRKHYCSRQFLAVHIDRIQHKADGQLAPFSLVREMEKVCRHRMGSISGRYRLIGA
jgi:hypothetical protein